MKMVIDSGLLEEEPVMDVKLGISTTQAPAIELLERIGISSSSIEIQAESHRT